MSAIDPSSLPSVDLSSAISVAVALKARGAAKAQGAAVVAMLDDVARLQQQLGPAEPHRGRSIDVRG